MKLSYALLGSIILAANANAAISLGFSAGTTNIANGFADVNGVSTATARIWGIVVDSDGDGFDGLGTSVQTSVNGGRLNSQGTLAQGGLYEPGFALSPTTAGNAPTGQALKVNSVTTDDVLFLSSNLMLLSGGEYRLTTITNLTYGGNVGVGDSYAVIWFDVLRDASNAPLTALDRTKVVASGRYGFWQDTFGTGEGAGKTVVNSTVLPADGGAYTTATTGPAGMFAGTETNMASTLALVPEPSSALLGVIGALGLLRRRRN